MVTDTENKQADARKERGRETSEIVREIKRYKHPVTKK